MYLPQIEYDVLNEIMLMKLQNECESFELNKPLFGGQIDILNFAFLKDIIQLQFDKSEASGKTYVTINMPDFGTAANKLYENLNLFLNCIKINDKRLIEIIPKQANLIYAPRHILEVKYPERRGTSTISTIQFDIYKMKNGSYLPDNPRSTSIIHGDRSQLLLTDFTDVEKTIHYKRRIFKHLPFTTKRTVHVTVPNDLTCDNELYREWLKNFKDLLKAIYTHLRDTYNGKIIVVDNLQDLIIRGINQYDHF